MSLISMKFVLFTGIAVGGYYLIPKKAQWVWLLVASYVYYLSAGAGIAGFLLFSTAVSFLAALWMESLSKTNEKKTVIRKKKRRVLILALLFNFGMLGVLKYTNFAIENINLLFGLQIPGQNLILPLGISFYTFQSVGYVLDVYWERQDAEHNPFRYALFVSFFPQLLQGPIGRFSRLACQLYEEHAFSWEKIERGVQRILWGYFKKMVLADNAGIFVDAIFGDLQTYKGLAIAGVLAYTVQLYGDFSGGMDVVIGIASMFGIELDENFKQPFFARSITDFWHRWHITLGTWMKDYVFYPVSLSKWMGWFGKMAKKRFGKTIGRALPICLANLIVFLVVGIWHGAAWKYIVYGMYNGVIIAVSGLLAKPYREWKKKLHISDNSRGWICFQILRTFLLVNISWFFDRADTVKDALTMMKNAVVYWDPAVLLTISVGHSGTAYTAFSLMIICAGCVVLFVVSVLKERGVKIRETIHTLPLAVRYGIYLALLFSIPMFGQPPALTGGFIYAQF